MYEDLKGKTALVTGAGKKTSIGYAIAGRLAVERPEEIRPALEAAFALGRTACINVAVDLSVISPESVALANLGGYRK